MIILDELQQDTLVEMFNISIGAAAASLSEMVDEEIQLSVPQLSCKTRQEVEMLLVEQASGHVSGVSQGFNGPFHGNAMLLFPVEKSLELVQLMLRDTVGLDKLSELEEEALCEIGNIILNAGLCSLADIFEQEIMTDIPKFTIGSGRDVLRVDGITGEESDVALFLRIDFKIEKHEIYGYLLYLLDIKSVKNLICNINRYLELNQVGS